MLRTHFVCISISLLEACNTKQISAVPLQHVGAVWSTEYNTSKENRVTDFANPDHRS